MPYKKENNILNSYIYYKVNCEIVQIFSEPVSCAVKGLRLKEKH